MHSKKRLKLKMRPILNNQRYQALFKYQRIYFPIFSALIKNPKILTYNKIWKKKFKWNSKTNK